MQFVRPDGTLRKTLAYVDTGDADFEFTASLVKELGLESGQPIRARFGGMDLKVSPSIKASGSEGKSMAAGMTLEANLPATVLDQYDVLLDYGKRELTLAPPGTLHHEGVRIPCKVNAKTGMVSVEASVNATKYAFSVDNGAAYIWIDDGVAKQWAAEHPSWVRGSGAVGDANMNGLLPELTGIILRLPAIDLGKLQIESPGALGVGPGWSKTVPRFFDWYSQKTPVPVVGFLGGSVLRGFRLEIDYANAATYWARESQTDPHDLDQVGITIGPGENGQYVVIGLPTQSGKEVVTGVAVKDRLVSIDGASMTGATMGRVLRALHGRPGQTHHLVLERAGKQLAVDASVTRF